jgi:hypothetical protein
MMRGKVNSVSTAVALAVLLLCLTAIGSASAQTKSCTELSSATGKPGWMIVSGPGLSAPIAPVTVNPYPGWKSPSLPGSSWVSVASGYGSAPGNYTYEFTFCLCREGKHALSLSFFADNGATVYLNNTQIFATTGDYNFKAPVQTVNHGWVGGPGVNKLRIVVRNAGGPTGLDATLNITGASSSGCKEKREAEGSEPGRALLLTNKRSITKR